MRIALVSTYARPFAIGLRYVSSSLKAAGHHVISIFLTRSRRSRSDQFSDRLLRDVVGGLDGCDLIGFSLMTNTFHVARTLTEGLRRAGVTAPILWGGVHPTLQPEECLEHADIVCVGEGEQPMSELAERMEAGEDPTSVAGLWFRADGPFGNRRIIRNAVPPLRAKLDDLPFPDYELETQWVAEGERLLPADPRRLRGALQRFTLITSRGCPYHCAFCNNMALRSAYGQEGRWVRLRSLDQVLEEMRYALACFPTIEEMHIVDDLFFLQEAESIERFVDRYRAEVGLPLLFQVSPLTVNERKARAIARAPLKVVIMGIQSGSQDTLYNIFARPTPPERIAAAMDILAVHKIPTEYHYIVNNPYETEANVIETLRFIAQHHRPAKVIRTFPLMFFPGTPLSDRARQDGLIDSRHELAYEHGSTHASRVITRDYLTVLMRIVFALRNMGLPSGVVHRFIDLALLPGVRKLPGAKYAATAAAATYWLLRRIAHDVVYRPLAGLMHQFRKPPRKPRRQAVAKWTVLGWNHLADRVAKHTMPHDAGRASQLHGRLGPLARR